ncbi:MAG: alpha/beta hydrolase [Chloroflexota bacterium]|nr:alpha/beta hydrolase [Chloroflexota bacterium]
MPELIVPGGVRLVFDLVGNGEPLLLLPGTGQGAGLWALQVPCYSQRYQCIVLDTRGAGRSDVPDDGYSTAQMAGDAAYVLRSLGIGRAHVSGQSMGSAVAQMLALAEPDLVATLQLHSTWDRPYPHLVRQLRLRQELARRELWDLFAMNSVLALFTPEFANQHPHVLAEREAQLFAKPPAARGLVGHYDADLLHDTRGRLGAIRAPTLITYGTRDVATLPAYNEAVRKQIPGAEAHLFDGAGHLTFSEYPDAFNAVTLDFLTRHPL